MANNYKIQTHPETKGSMAYDRIMDEMRVLELSQQEAFVALAMSIGATAGASCNTDKEFLEALNQITQLSGQYYEKYKRISSQRKNEPREIIKLN